MKLKTLLESKNSEYTIAIDMDGVLADFDLGSRQALGDDKDTISTKEFWKRVNNYNKNVAPFFENLPAMKDAFTLMRFITNNFDNYFVLTASGYTPKNVEEQKRNWVRKVFSPLLKVVIVKKSADKAQYAGPDSILIDDRNKSIDPWKKAGGIGILYTSATDTITQLKKIIKS